MIDHVTSPVRNLQVSKDFYTACFEVLGFNLEFGEENVFWAFNTGNATLFEIAQCSQDKEPTAVHIAFRVDSKEAIHEFYEKAITLGAKYNGKPGPRPQYTPNYYAAFVLDPDDNNIEVMIDKAS